MDPKIVIEGELKFRGTRKWRPRWGIVTRLSPVADCLHLQLYRDQKERIKSGLTKASLSLEKYIGLEAGFTFDKESHTLALICQDMVLLLAFNSRETLLHWQTTIRSHLPQEQQYQVEVVQFPGKSRLTIGPARLHIRDGCFALVSGNPPRLSGLWFLPDLRRYGVLNGKFCFEGGSSCGKGEGLHVLSTIQTGELMKAFQLASIGNLQPKRKLSIKRDKCNNFSDRISFCSSSSHSSGTSSISSGNGSYQSSLEYSTPRIAAHQHHHLHSHNHNHNHSHHHHHNHTHSSHGEDAGSISGSGGCCCSSCYQAGSVELWYDKLKMLRSANSGLLSSMNGCNDTPGSSICSCTSGSTSNVGLDSNSLAQSKSTLNGDLLYGGAGQPVTGYLADWDCDRCSTTSSTNTLKRTTFNNHHVESHHQGSSPSSLSSSSTTTTNATVDPKLLQKLITGHYQIPKSFLASCQGVKNDADDKIMMNNMEMYDVPRKFQKIHCNNQVNQVNQELPLISQLNGKNTTINEMVKGFSSSIKLTDKSSSNSRSGQQSMLNPQLVDGRVGDGGPSTTATTTPATAAGTETGTVTVTTRNTASSTTTTTITTDHQNEMIIVSSDSVICNNNNDKGCSCNCQSTVKSIREQSTAESQLGDSNVLIQHQQMININHNNLSIETKDHQDQHQQQCNIKSEHETINKNGQSDCIQLTSSLANSGSNGLSSNPSNDIINGSTAASNATNPNDDGQRPSNHNNQTANQTADQLNYHHHQTGCCLMVDPLQKSHTNNSNHVNHHVNYVNIDFIRSLQYYQNVGLLKKQINPTINPSNPAICKQVALAPESKDDHTDHQKRTDNCMQSKQQQQQLEVNYNLMVNKSSSSSTVPNDKDDDYLEMVPLIGTDDPSDQSDLCLSTDHHIYLHHPHHAHCSNDCAHLISFFKVNDSLGQGQGDNNNNNTNQSIRASTLSFSSSSTASSSNHQVNHHDKPVNLPLTNKKLINPLSRSLSDVQRRLLSLSSSTGHRVATNPPPSYADHHPHSHHQISTSCPPSPARLSSSASSQMIKPLFGEDTIITIINDDVRTKSKRSDQHHQKSSSSSLGGPEEDRDEDEDEDEMLSSLPVPPPPPPPPLSYLFACRLNKSMESLVYPFGQPSTRNHHHESSLPVDQLDHHQYQHHQHHHHHHHPHHHHQQFDPINSDDHHNLTSSDEDIYHASQIRVTSSSPFTCRPMSPSEIKRSISLPTDAHISNIRPYNRLNCYPIVINNDNNNDDDGDGDNCHPHQPPPSSTHQHHHQQQQQQLTDCQPPAPPSSESTNQIVKCNQSNNSSISANMNNLILLNYNPANPMENQLNDLNKSSSTNHQHAININHQNHNHAADNTKCANNCSKNSVTGKSSTAITIKPRSANEYVTLDANKLKS